MKRILSVLALAAAMLGTTPFANATIIQYQADLSGANEAVPTPSLGTGTALLTIDDAAYTMTVDVVFSNLLGNVTASHIHCCTALPNAGNAGVASPTPTFPGFPSGVTSGNYLSTFDLTMASSYNASFITANGGVDGARAALLTGLDAGLAYLNIHTSLYPGGEIRGFFTSVSVPEPASIGLFALGLCGIAALRRKRSAQ